MARHKVRPLRWLAAALQSLVGDVNSGALCNQLFQLIDGGALGMLYPNPRAINVPDYRRPHIPRLHKKRTSSVRATLFVRSATLNLYLFLRFRKIQRSESLEL